MAGTALVGPPGMLCFTITYTIAVLLLTTPWLSITFRLNANTVSVGTIGTIKVGVAVLAPISDISGTVPLGGRQLCPMICYYSSTRHCIMVPSCPLMMPSHLM